MTEEEKKAIEYLKRHIIPYYGYKGRIEFMLNDVILNLIEKQQKENEELKEKNDNNNVYKDLQEDLTSLLKREFIPKDKIREKLEKIEKEKIQYYDAGQPLIYMLLKNQLKNLIEED